MSSLLKRSITGVIFVAVLLGAVYFGELSTFILFLAIVVLGADELYSIVKKSKTINPLGFWGIVTSAVLFVLYTLSHKGIIEDKFLFVVVILIFLTFIFELFRKKSHPFVNITYTIIGCVYVALPFAMLYNLGHFDNYSFSDSFNYQLIFGILFIQWANDTGAYLAGMSIGKHKLFERISPNKTWEGAIGGLLLAVGVAYACSVFLGVIDIVDWIVIGILIVIFGSFGDLVQSQLKRSLSIKDSGNILPGHGGILDRFDGLIISVPIVYSYLQLIS